MRVGEWQELPVDLIEVRGALRVDHDDDDVRLTRILIAAAEHYADFTRRLMVAAEYEETFDAWGDGLALRWGMVRGLVSVRCDTDVGSDVDMPISDWRAETGRLGLTTVRYVGAAPLPTLRDGGGAIRVRFSGGPISSDPRYTLSEVDIGNILVLAGSMFDKDEFPEEEKMRRMMGNRRALV